MSPRRPLAVIGVCASSLNVTPSRIWNVQTVASSFAVQLSASTGLSSGSPSDSERYSPVWPFRQRPPASATVIGSSSPLGVVRPKRNVPPGVPAVVPVPAPVPV